MSKQITTISFFKYEGLGSKIWAFGMMQFAHKYLATASGLQFYKLMGSGRGMGFNPYPDWSTYTLLCVWDSESDADVFIQESQLYGKYKDHTEELWTLYMYNSLARGYWSGKQPFEAVHFDGNELLAVITRATIRPRKLRKFWSYVPTSHRSLSDNKGLIYTKGIGEVPVLQMATFSIWKSEEDLKKFAYESKEHHKAIQMTKELDWYSEELFSRFKIFKTVGSWQGIELPI